MLIVESYTIAVAMCLITMLCWGSWANTQKLASNEWQFQLFYWDYSLGVLLLTLLFAFTIGSTGEEGRAFMPDISQAGSDAIQSALIGGVVFNLANILLVTAIDIAGMAVAFPVAIGLALVIGVVSNYLAEPLGDPVFLFAGVGLVTAAIIVCALIYARLPQDEGRSVGKGLAISVIAGIAMGFFYRFVAASISMDFANPEAGLMTPYSAGVVFAVGLLVSNVIWLVPLMYKPISGEVAPIGEYFSKGTPRLHLVGILGGAIWCVGFSFSFIASGAAGPAISYGLGQGATMVAAFWGVFIWKEFKDAPAGTSSMITAMFALFFVGLGLIVYSR
ncbi:multidrug DMT transporter permease [Congregibacter variabilis]|uniref:Multidrug DMT transporter permease n=1 Tax=Congregibacter variabilis TaxID=3081200 RepID=A0ABZ0I182_9GAMM|nr:multidrug DMT transporter permease [Congregibacter sp. IMCC43200]